MTVNSGDVVRVTAVMDHSLEGAVMNVYHAKMLGAGSTDIGFMEKMRDLMDIGYGYIDNFMPDTLDFVEIRGFNVTQSQPMPTFAFNVLTSGGVDVADPLPSVLSCLVVGRTGVNRAIYRKFLGPFTEANQEDAEWTSAILTAVAQMHNYIKTAVTVSGELVQVGLYSPTLATWYPIIESVVDSVIAYQRRRRKGRGQ